MTQAECKKIIAVMMTVWKTYTPAKDEVIMLMRYLGEYEYADVSAALDALVVTSDFAPTVGQLARKVQELKSAPQMGEMEAWALARKCIQGNAEYDELPEPIRKALGSKTHVKSMGLDENFNANVAMSQFLRAYRTEIEREREYAAMPANVKRLIDSTCARIGGNHE